MSQWGLHDFFSYLKRYKVKDIVNWNEKNLIFQDFYFSVIKILLPEYVFSIIYIKLYFRGVDFF